MEVIDYATISHDIGTIHYVAAYIPSEENISTSIPKSAQLTQDTTNRLFIKIEVNDIRVTFSKNESLFFTGQEEICEICGVTSTCIKLQGEKTTEMSRWRQGRIYCCFDCLTDLRIFRTSVTRDIQLEDILKAVI